MTSNLSRAVWRKSSLSGENGGNCVEVANLDDSVAVRDSKHPDGGALVFSPAEWAIFLDATKSGEFDQ
jgi:hypothetical protein